MTSAAIYARVSSARQKEQETIVSQTGALRGLTGTRQVTFLARWPADRAMQHARDRIRKLTRRSRLLLPVEVIVKDVNRFLRGWMNYYGAFYRSALYRLLGRINAYLLRWVRNKYRRLRARRKAHRAWNGVTQRYPRFFAHWAWTAAIPQVW